MEQAPVKEMTPELKSNGDPKNLNTNVHIFSNPGEHYLVYVADPGQAIEINLEGNTNYKLEILDTWNMNITEESSVKPGLFSYTTTSPYTAFRFSK
jgi:hypothetical protein